MLDLLGPWDTARHGYVLHGCLANGAEEFLSKPLQLKDLQKLSSYVKAAPPVPKTVTKKKRKLHWIFTYKLYQQK